MRQILNPFVNPDFSIFPKKTLNNLYVATMTQYLEQSSVNIAFPPPRIVNSLTETISKAGKNQMHIAETDKHAHVTYFFNGLKNTAFPGESDIFIDSVKKIEENPAMSSAEISDKVIEALDQGLYDFIVLNFANADLLAHTGNYAVVVKGIEAVDAAIAKIYAKVIEKNDILVITADHGNAESLVYKSSGEAETKHDDSPVFFYLIGSDFVTSKTEQKLAEEVSAVNGILADVAPTILQLMGISVPAEMTGQSLLSLLTS